MSPMNGIDAYIHGEDDPAISEAIRRGDIVYVSGQVSKSPDGEFIHGDFRTQCMSVFANVDRILTHYGATRRQVVAEVVYIVDFRTHVSELNALRMEFYDDHRPTNTTVGVTDLFFPGQILEISVVVDLTLPA